MAYQKQETIQIAVEDRVSAKLNPYFDLIADKIEQVHHGGGKILIYCRAGQSRSATLCIAYFMKYHDMTYDQAFQYVRNCRPIIHPNIGFVRQMKDYEEKLKKRKEVLLLKLANMAYAVECCVEEARLEAAPAELAVPPLKRKRAVVWLQEPLHAPPASYEMTTVEFCDTPGPLQPRRPPVTQPSDLQHTAARGKRKTAFTRIAKPNEIAVSFFSCPLDLAIFDSASNIRFKLQTKPEHSSLAIPQLHQAYAVTERLHLESLGNLQTNLMPSFVRARRLVSPLLLSVTQYQTDILELNDISTVNSGSVERPGRQVRSLNLSCKGGSTSSLTKPKLNSRRARDVPAAAAVPVLTATRATVNLAETGLVCPSTVVPATQWQREAGLADQAGAAATPVRARAVLAPLRGAASQEASRTWLAAPPAPAFDIPIECYHKLDFSFTEYENSAVAEVLVETVLGSSHTAPRLAPICRQFPYYSTVVVTTTALELCRPGQEEVVVCPASVPSRPSTAPAPVERPPRPRPAPQLQWAQERFQSDECCAPPPPCATPSQPPVCRAGRLGGWAVREAVSLAEPVTLDRPDLIGRFYFPLYNPVLLRRECDPVQHPAAQRETRLVLEMCNLYSVPSSLALHSPAPRPALHTADTRSAPTTTAPDLRQAADTLEDIPSEIHDIAEMRHILAAEESNSQKSKIWFEVFKRTLMRKRPTFPHISYIYRCSVVAAVSKHFVLESLQTSFQDSFSAAVARRTLTIPLGIAVATSQEIIEKYTEFTKLAKATVFTENFSKRRMVRADQYIGDDINIAFETCKSFSGAGLSIERAVSKVSFPNRLYCVSECEVWGEVWQGVCPPRQQCHAPSPPRKICPAPARLPFSLVSRPRGAASCLTQVTLATTRPLPSYNFVQDVEDQADLTTHTTTVAEVARTTETDSFWFFALETATVQPNKTEAGNNPSNFLLFLPDRKLAPKIGQEDIFPDSSTEETAGSDITIMNPEAVVAEVLHEIKDQTCAMPDKPGDKRVTFERGAVASRGSEDLTASGKKKTVKTVYYGRDRSKSRTRLKAVETGGKARRGPRDRSASCGAAGRREAEVMANLARSVDEANSILLRRREPEMMSPRVGRSANRSPSPELVRSPRLNTRSEERFARRARDAARNREETARMERSKRSNDPVNTAPNQPISRVGVERPNKRGNTASINNQAETGRGEEGGGRGEQVDQVRGITGGIINFASNLIGSRGRRDQSENRARGLLRKSAKNFL